MHSLTTTTTTTSNPQKVLLQLQGQVYRETARAERPVPHLMTWLLDRRNLEAAWDRVRSSDGAVTPGEDGLTCAAVAPRLGDFLGRLTEDLFHGRYEPGRPRWIDVPKSRPGEFRRLGILTVRDRVVHAALKQVLEPVLEPLFLPCSFGFRPGRCVAGALAEATRLLNGSVRQPAPYQAGVAVDVAGCFDSIDHEVMLEGLRAQVSDPDLLRLVEQLLTAGGTQRRHFWHTRRCGLVQGSALSPLLCNLYLHPLDRELTTLGQAQGDGLQALRYADNLLLLGRDERLVRLALHAVGRQLRLLRQALGEARPRALPVQHGIDWLGVRLRPRPFPLEELTTFGYVIPDGKVHHMLGRLGEITTPPSENIDADVFNLERWIVAINRQLREWRQAYLYADNAAEVFRALDDYVQLRFGRLLSRLTGERPARVRRLYRVRLPRGFWSWQVNGVRMTVLSSLAPHCPGYLTHPPAWMGRDGTQGRAHTPPLGEEPEEAPALEPGRPRKQAEAPALPEQAAE